MQFSAKFTVKNASHHQVLYRNYIIIVKFSTEYTSPTQFN